MQPKELYDEVRLTIAGVVSALDIQKFYGIFLRGDIDNDGVPDCKDTESCNTTIKNIVLNDVCQGGTLKVSGVGNTSTNYRIVMREQGIDQTFTTAQNGAFDQTFTMTKPGRYTMLFYDGSDNLLNNVPYTVHPNRTTWRKDATTADWNEWNNWTEGSPYCCTDVVIPSQAERYPVLSISTADEALRPDLFCCNYIHFEPQAAVGAPQRLNYTKAWTEWQLMPNRYYLLSATLHNTYTGDAFVPAAMKGVQNNDYFTTLDATTSPQNRFDPIIYQRLWNTTAPGKLLGNGTGTETTVAVTQTEWTQHFNHLKYAYAMGQGFSLWVDNDSLPSTQAIRLRFPKEQTSYNYYNDYDRSQLSLQETELERSQVGRFIYEDAAVSQPNDFSYTGFIHGTEQTQARQVYSHSVPLTLHVEGEQLGTFFLVGNPFQSYINVAALLAANADVIKGVKLYDGNTNNTLVLANGELVGNATRIGPGEAFFVETNSAQTAIDLVLNSDMLTDVATSTTATTADAIGITLSSTGYDGSHATAWLPLGEASVTSSSLFDGEAKPQVALFVLPQGGEACDVANLNADGSTMLPLGIYTAGADTLTLQFKAVGKARLADYALYDCVTGSYTPLSQPVTIICSSACTDIGRYVIVPATTASISNARVNANTAIRFQVMHHAVAAISAIHNLQCLRVYTLSAQLVSTAQGSHMAKLMCRGIDAGCYVLRLVTTDGQQQSVKVWVE